MADENGTPEIISRKAAKARGLRHYFTGKPCKRGHIALRYVGYAACVECALVNLRAGRVRNRERYRARDREWKNANREKVRAQYRARYARNREKYTRKTRRYYENNGALVREKRKAYHYRTYVNKEIRLKARERTKRWAKDNPDQARTNARNAKARRKAREGVVVGSHTAADIKDILLLQKGRCAYCKTQFGKKYDVDHIVALARGGTNDRRNLQLLCRPCNLEKYARDPIDHARSLGLLL